ncbi:MAG: LamG domain-containing protein [Candidatus Pacebacteria bacterium]|nr:LamG domain-containing protein [Candidatus Paceibacterota bacterium]
MYIFDTTDYSLYLNGDLEVSEAHGITPGDDNLNLNIGKWTSSGYWTSGQIDDVRIYNRALSEDEVKYLYETTAPNYE